LTVKYNNDKSRDYTNPTLPSGEGNMVQPGELGLIVLFIYFYINNYEFIDRMHSNPGLLPLQRSASNEDYRYGKKINFFSNIFLEMILLFSDYFTAARGRPPSTSGLPPGYDMPGKTLFFLILIFTLFYFF